MSEALRYTRAFAKALADHLRGRVPEFTERRQGSGGCETCGYGASEYDVIDMQQLEVEIDKFASAFEKAAKEQQ